MKLLWAIPGADTASKLPKSGAVHRPYDIKRHTSKKFDRVQRRTEREIYGLRETNRSELIFSINNHKKINVVIQMFKCRQGTSIPALRTYAGTINHQHETRSNKSLLKLPLVKTETAKRSLYFQGPYCFKEVPRDIRSITSIVLSKSKVKEHFLSWKNLYRLRTTL